MTWKELRNGVYRLDGSLRDIYVLGTSRDDWQKWAEYINEKYVVNWYAEGYGNNATQESIDTEFIKFRWDSEYCSTTTRIFLDKLQINCHFFTETEIENDVAPWEIHSIDDHNRLVDYMKAISYLLGREVILTEENVEEAVLMRVNRDVVEFIEAV